MSYYKPNSVYFGPELEMFNIIYKIEPFKGFPVWVHPGLTVSGQMNTVLSKKLAKELPEIMFISRSRQHFLDFLDHENLVDNGYVLQNADSLDSFVLCYVYHDLLDTDDPVDFPKNQTGN
jgi:hypothetical protein